MANDIEERLNALRSRDLSQQHVDTPNGNDLCTLELRVPSKLLHSMSEEQVYNFLRTEGSDVLMRAFLTASSVSVPRSLEGGFECHVDTKGNAGCSGHGEIRF